MINNSFAVQMNFQSIRNCLFERLTDQFEKYNGNWQKFIKSKEISLKIKQLETQYKEQFSEIYTVLQNIIDNPINKEPRTKIGYKK